MGIIGGADGPTVIYVTSSINWGLIISAVAVIAGVIISLLILRHKKRKAQEHTTN